MIGINDNGDRPKHTERTGKYNSSAESLALEQKNSQTYDCMALTKLPDFAKRNRKLNIKGN